MKTVKLSGVNKKYCYSSKQAFSLAKKLSKESKQRWGNDAIAEVNTGHSVVYFKNGKRYKTQKVTPEDAVYY